ncbi:MAG: V-type ATPase subunit [Lachnospiraceae bacterium]|nr:V-type ATPase subunit [Lachnospiraceae bacterium]
MGGMFSYSGIATKTRAMSSKLLTKEDFTTLAEMGSVRDAVEYLRQHTDYAKVLKDIPEERLHRGEIERRLIRSLYHDFSKIYRFCNLKQRSVLELYFCKYEIQVLKGALRKVFNPHADRILLGRGEETFQCFSHIDMEKLSQASSIWDFLEALKRTPYYDVLYQVSMREKKSLFDYEMVLDMFYFSNIWKKKEKLLKGTERELMTRVYGSQIDMLNMMWVYRAKHYYKMPSAMIYTLVIPISYKLKKQQLQEMVEAENEKELLEAARNTWYGKKQRDLSETDLEQLYRQLLWQIYQAEQRKNPYSMTSITSYLYYKEQEIDQLTTILECVRYGLAPAEKSAYIP